MRPIRDSDLPPVKELTRAFFRAVNPHVEPVEFEEKWQAALRSPMRFMRSFPQAWHVDLLDVPRARVPGGRCLCFGDAHPDNFGLITFTVGPRYVFNDLDDAGPGLAALDALRYFTVLRLLLDDRKALAELMELYEDMLQGNEPLRELPEALYPDVAARDARQLAKWTEGEAFRFDEPSLNLSRAEAGTGDRLLEALGRSGQLSEVEVLALAHRDRDAGGSGGLERYLILGRERGGERRLRLLELKETTHAATSWNNFLHEDEDRLERAKASIWRGLEVPFYREVQVGRSVYLLRDRLGRASVDIEALSKRDLRAVLEAQVSILARQHAEAFAGLDLDKLDDWLRESLDVTARRWLKAYERARRR
ncbi:DUF2252 family protein [Sorangium cellulosum]|uniref:DUF2252 domain-containing protein n=1 Tax=Sorangium cellulosum So0157-2 TaxID=1254432 RepID=S4XRZ1_SORCE|nr:DUF2252 family protein [Sorangium cellulosum]AGP35284.1 hypothetical protein SCE1572_12620 [Sorangium cellulosum So0157-2]